MNRFLKVVHATTTTSACSDKEQKLGECAKHDKRMIDRNSVAFVMAFIARIRRTIVVIVFLPLVS